MQKWEYLVLESDRWKAESQMVDTMNKWGKEDWELVSPTFCSVSKLIFKRPLSE